MKTDVILAGLAVEYWKLLRSFERAIDLTPHDDRTRLCAQARYSGSRLQALLLDAEMKIVSFDGLPFEINLPAIAINGEDVAGFDNVVVERTVEPAVLSGMTVVLMGKVLLGQQTKEGNR